MYLIQPPKKLVYYSHPLPNTPSPLLQDSSFQITLLSIGQALHLLPGVPHPLLVGVPTLPPCHRETKGHLRTGQGLGGVVDPLPRPQELPPSLAVYRPEMYPHSQGKCSEILLQDSCQYMCICRFLVSFLIPSLPPSSPFQKP